MYSSFNNGENKMAAPKSVKLTRDTDHYKNSSTLYNDSLRKPSTIYVFANHISYIEQQVNQTGSIVCVGNNTFYVNESPAQIFQKLHF